MPILVIDTIKPKNNGSFAIVEDIDVVGGFRAVVNVTARDAIPTGHRKAGMLVYTAATDQFWKLGSGLTNGDWTLVVFGGGGNGDATSILGIPIRLDGAPATADGLSIDGTDHINSIGTQPGAGTGGSDVVWAAGLNVIIRLDTATGTVQRFQTGIGILNNPGFDSNIAYSPASMGVESLWIANGSAGLYRMGIIQTSPYPITIINVYAFDVDVDTANGFVWAPDFLNSSVAKINPATNTYVSIPVNGTPTNVLVAAGSVWVASQNGVLDRIDPTTDTVTNTYDVGVLNGTAISKMAYDPTNNQIFFLEGYNEEVSKFDIATETFTNPSATIEGSTHYDLVVADDKLFVTAQTSTNFLGNSELTAFDSLGLPGGPSYLFNKNLGEFSLYGCIHITAAYNGTEWRIYGVNTDTYQFKHCSTTGSSIQSIDITRGFRIGPISPRFGSQEAQFGGISRVDGTFPYENWTEYDFTSDADYTLQASEWKSRWFWITDQSNVLTQSRAIIFPTSPDTGTWWVVWNATTFPIECLSEGSLSGTGVIIQPDAAGFVFSGGGAVFGPEAGGGTLAGDVQGPVGSNVVANITGISGQTKVISQLQWDDLAVMGLDQEISPSPSTPTSDLNFTSQAPNAGGGVLTGRPGNINFAIPAPVGGADPGSVYFFIGPENPIRVDSDGVFVTGFASSARTDTLGVVTVVSTDRYVFVEPSSGGTTVNLYTPDPSEPGREVIVADALGTASTDNITVVSPAGNINGSSDYVINSDWGFAKFVTTPAGQWQRVG